MSDCIDSICSRLTCGHRRDNQAKLQSLRSAAWLLQLFDRSSSNRETESKQQQQDCTFFSNLDISTISSPLLDL